jgi:hypothetical protein
MNSGKIRRRRIYHTYLTPRVGPPDSLCPRERVNPANDLWRVRPPDLKPEKIKKEEAR